MQPPKKDEQTKAATAVLSTAAKAKQNKAKKEAVEKDASGAMDVDNDDKASICASAADGAASIAAADVGSIAATQGTTVVGSAADWTSDLGSEMDVDQQAALAGLSKDESAPAAPESSAVTPEENAKKDEAVKEAETTTAEAKDEAKKDDEKKEEKKEPEPTDEILNNPCRVLQGQKQFISFPKEIDGDPVRYVPLIKGRHMGFVLLNDTKPDEPEDLFMEDDAPQGGEEEKEPEAPEPFEWTDN